MVRPKKLSNKEKRAHHLITAYNQTDRKYQFGKGDLTPQWVADNILSKSCKYCGETDWTKIGCNRIDATKPHTMDNVEPCCTECNRRLPRPNARKNKPKTDRLTCDFVVYKMNTESLMHNIGIYSSFAEALEMICSYK